MSIQVKNLTFSYDESPLVENLSFIVEANQIGLISGESGIGKSTLFNVIAGLIFPQKGTITLKDVIFNEGDFSLNTEKREIGYVFQDFALFPHINAQKNIEYALKTENNELCNELISKLDLLELLDKMPHELSGGQQQRVAILRAILMKPNILLLDEPFSNLDKNNIFAVQEIIKNVIELFQIPCLLISHDMRSNENFEINREISIS